MLLATWLNKLIDW